MEIIAYKRALKGLLSGIIAHFKYNFRLQCLNHIIMGRIYKQNLKRYRRVTLFISNNPIFLFNQI